MRGYIAPGITADTLRQGEVLRHIAATPGLRLERLGRGRALRLTGPGVCIVMADLGALSLADLKAPTEAQLESRAKVLRLAAD